jgi:hypothetical protein
MDKVVRRTIRRRDEIAHLRTQQQFALAFMRGAYRYYRIGPIGLACDSRQMARLSNKICFWAFVRAIGVSVVYSVVMYCGWTLFAPPEDADAREYAKTCISYTLFSLTPIVVAYLVHLLARRGTCTTFDPLLSFSILWLRVQLVRHYGSRHYLPYLTICNKLTPNGH